MNKYVFRLAVVVPKFWNYLSVPEQIDAKEVIEKMSSQNKIELSQTRKYCDETKVNEDEDPESVNKLVEKLRQGTCHGRDLNHLIFDYKVLEKLDLDAKANFVLTDGGLLLRDTDQ